MSGELERVDDGEMRASDGDRAAVAKRLQQAVDEGRLDLADYDERLRDTYAARTYGELAKLTADLPAPTPKPVDKVAEKSADRHEAWRSWGGAAVVLVTIWGITSIASGGAIFFWPMFPLGIWAAILVASALGGRSCGSR